MGQAFTSPTQSFQAVFAVDPRMKTGMEAAAKEMAKLQGTPLRTVMYFSLVPPGDRFDRKLALNDASAAEAEAKAKQDDKPKGGGGFGGMLGRLKSAADEASKRTDTKSAGPPKQATLATITDEVHSITPGAVPPELFAPPAGYRDVTNRQPPAE